MNSLSENGVYLRFWRTSVTKSVQILGVANEDQSICLGGNFLIGCLVGEGSDGKTMDPCDFRQR